MRRLARLVSDAPTTPAFVFLAAYWTLAVVVELLFPLLPHR